MRSRTHATTRRSSRRATQSSIVMEALDSRLLLAGDVMAVVLHDLNGNGLKDKEEPGIEGWTVYIDLNGNKAFDADEPSAISDVDGDAFIQDVPAGEYDAVEVLPPGWAPSPGYAERMPVLVQDGERADVLFLNVTSSNGAIEGTVWNDVDGDGVWGDPAVEPGIPGWTVFVDLNNNNDPDVGEPSAITDANGHFLFSNIAPGDYRVREIPAAGWDPTIGYDREIAVTVEPVLTTLIDFGNFSAASLGEISGAVWNDVNANGTRDAADAGLAGWRIFLDLNGNVAFDADLNGDGIANDPEPSAITDPLGVYTFPAVAAGTYTIVMETQSGWNLSPGHPAVVNAAVTGQATTNIQFAVYTVALGSISGRVWNDLDGNGLIGAAEPGIPGWTVFIDQDSNGIADPGEPSAVSDASGDYTLPGIPMGAQLVREIPAIGWRPTAPGTGMQLVSMLNATDLTGINFGNQQRTDSLIAGRAFNDANRNGARDAGERGLPGITVYLDQDNNGALDPGEPSLVTSEDLFYTPDVDEAGLYEFNHLRGGDYVVREVLPVELSATLPADSAHAITLVPGEERRNVDFANRYRPGEIHGALFHDLDDDHVRDPEEPALDGVSVYIDLDRDDLYDDGVEPRTTTGPDGSYHFTDLEPGAYVVRDIELEGYAQTYPTTTGGILWPAGTSNPAVGDVIPLEITHSLADGESFTQTVSLTLPASGALTNMVDVFLLFDDTGSFTSNSPIVRAAFPQIIADLQAALPGINLAFGVGRLEEYANFASEYGTGRPFILNQPMVAASTPGFAAAIQGALDRMAPGYGGDTPETDIEALYQVVTGRGFDGNNNGSFLDSGAAGLVSTQLTPGTSGDVPPFSSFTAAGPVLPASGTLGGAGFRAGALPIILTATDTGFAFQPRGETSIVGLNGLTLPLSALTQFSRPSTPFNSGAGIQETITALNALGALVIGLGTNAQSTLDPRQGLESIARLTGSINRSAATIANGTADPIAPGDPFYFQIATGFAASVSNGVIAAIQNAVTSVAVDITLKASDPRVHITSAPAEVLNVSAGQTATFDVTFTGDGIPHRFDLQFVRKGTNVVLGSIPVVLGTPIPGDGYEFEDVCEGEIHDSVDFGEHQILPTSLVGALPAAVITTAFPVAWSGVGGSGGKTYDIYVSDDGGAYTPWLTGTADTSAVFQGESFHAYSFYSVAHDSSGATEPAPAGLDASTYVAAVDGTAGADTLILRRDPANLEMLQVFTDPSLATPAYAISLYLLPTLGINGLGGDDTITIASTDGAMPIPTGGLAVDGGGSADVLHILAGLGGAGAVNVGATSISFTSGGTTGQVDYSGFARIDLGITGVDGTLDVSGGAVHLDSPTMPSAVTIGGTGQVLLGSPGQVLHAQSLVFTADGVLDLADGALVVNDPLRAPADVLADLTAALARGRTADPATLWQGTGIRSSAASALAGLGVAVDNLGEVLVKRTWNGDANLDGLVDGRDYHAIDLGFLAGAARYQDGNFDYAGGIDGDDYYLIDQAFLGQTSVLAPSAPAAKASAFSASTAPITPFASATAPAPTAVAPGVSFSSLPIISPMDSLLGSSSSVLG